MYQWTLVSMMHTTLTDFQTWRFQSNCERSENHLQCNQTMGRRQMLFLGVLMLKTFRSRRKHQVDLYIPDRGNPRVIIKSPEGERADIHFEWFEHEQATKVAEMIAAGFSAKETSSTNNAPT